MKILIILGGGMMAFGIVGKGALTIIRALKSRKVSLKSGKLGKYYKGGFDKKMTAREAALILSIRESSTKQEIKESHRRLMMLNHPDSGGSTYLASKINESKELLLLFAVDQNKV